MSIDIFAAALAEADAEAQAQFFNNFYRHLKMCCKGKQETQVCYIADYLDENGREFAKDLDTFAKLSLETRVKTEQDMGELYRQRRALEEEIDQLRESKQELQQ